MFKKDLQSFRLVAMGCVMTLKRFGTATGFTNPLVSLKPTNPQKNNKNYVRPSRLSIDTRTPTQKFTLKIVSSFMHNICFTEYILEYQLKISHLKNGKYFIHDYSDPCILLSKIKRLSRKIGFV